MSRANSRWTMAGMFMGPHRRRSTVRKRRDQSTADETDELNRAPRGQNEMAEGSQTEGSLAEIFEVPQVITDTVPGMAAQSRNIEEQSWTSVTTQHEPSSASATGSVVLPQAELLSVEENTTMASSGSFSVEFVDKQIEASPDQIAPHATIELERNDTGLTLVDNEKLEFEARLGTVLSELASVDVRRQELDDENRQYKQKIQSMEASLRSLQDEMEEAKRGEQQARREAEDTLRRISAFEDQHRQSETMKKVEGTGEVERQNWEETLVRLEESVKRGNDLEARNARLLEERQAGVEAIEGLRGLNVKANTSVGAALVELENERRDREEAERQLRESTRRSEDLVERNRSITEELQAVEEAQQNQEGIQRRLEESTKRGDELEGRNRRLVGELEVVEEELKGLRGLNAKVNETLELALANLETAQQDRNEAHRETDEMAKRNADLEQRNLGLLVGCEAGEEEMKGLRRLIRKTQNMLDMALADLDTAQHDRDEANRQLDVSAKRGDELEDRNRRLLGDFQVGEDRMKGLRTLNGKAQNALDVALAELKKAERDKEGVLEQLDEILKEREHWEERNRRLLEECKAEEEKAEDLRRLHVKTASALETALGELKAASHQKVELSNIVARQAQELTKKDKELEKLTRSQPQIVKWPNQRQLHTLERHNRMLVDQLRRQSEQLRQKTLSGQSSAPQTPRPSSKGEILGGIEGMVERLNSEVYQAAAHIADSLDFTSLIDLDTQEIEGVAERATVMIGKPLALVMEAISTRDAVEFNYLPVQIALQACLVSCCAKIITSWCPGHWEYGDFLATIYTRIVGIAPPDIAASWRTLTERQLKKPSDNNLQTEMEEYLLRNVIDTLVISGWRKTQSEARDSLAKFHDRIRQIAKLALRLNLAIGDNWQVIVIHPNESFDANKMEDAYEGEINRRGNRVVCTTDLGLGTGGSIVSKPKVVVRAMLTEVIGYDSF